MSDEQLPEGYLDRVWDEVDAAMMTQQRMDLLMGEAVQSCLATDLTPSPGLSRGCIITLIVLGIVVLFLCLIVIQFVAEKPDTGQGAGLAGNIGGRMVPLDTLRQAQGALRVRSGCARCTLVCSGDPAATPDDLTSAPLLLGIWKRLSCSAPGRNGAPVGRRDLAGPAG